MKIQLHRILILLCMTLVIGAASAQDVNPFELEHKLTNPQEWVDVKVEDLPSAVQAPDSIAMATEGQVPTFEGEAIAGNPFEIAAGPVDQPVVDAKKASPAPVKKVRKTLSETQAARVDQFKMILSIILLIALALISTLLRHVIIKVVEGFKSDNLLRSYFRSTGRRVSLPNILLEVFFVLNAAFTCFLLAAHYDILDGQPIFAYLRFLLAVSVVVFGKHLVLFIIREVFPIQKEIAEYNFTINLFLSILGLILLPCNLILGFSAGGMATLMLYFIGLTFVLVFGYLVFRAIMIGSKFLGSNRFHFFVYLCTVEIAPLVILVKVVKNYLGS